MVLPRISLLGWRTAAACIALAATAAAHEHHKVEDIDFGEPIDAILWIHMILQMTVWGILFPIGMVLGLSKSRWHVPLQSTCLLLTIGGIFLGHHHKGRQFPATAHGIMAKIITFIMVAQAGLGIYLKLHVNEKSVRPIAVKCHSFLGALFPVVGWVQMLLGVVTAFGYCMGGHLGQCLAHYIMGSAFIGYAAILVIMLQLGAAWLKRTGNSQEYLDSWVIMIWGIINTFTEHHDAWNKNWSHKDMQHTMMGILWWAGGALGIFLSRKGKRSFVPAVIIIMTGWGMSAHEQALMISSKIHGLFGYALMAAGAVRIIEVCFVLSDGASVEGHVRIFQYMTPYLLTLGGTMFMSATDEELHHVDDLGIDHVSYALFVFSLSFVLFLHMTFLVNLYSTTGKNAVSGLAQELMERENGYTILHARQSRDDGPAGPESFELTEHDDRFDGMTVGNGGSSEEDAKEFVIADETEVDWSKADRRQ